MPKLSCLYGGKEYTHGSEICQSGSVKRCIDGDWLDTARACTNDSTPAVKLEDFRIIDDTQAASLEPAEDQSPPKVARTIIAYAEFWSIQQSSAYLFFRGAATPGRVCSNETQNYKVPLEDVSCIGRKIQCRTNPTTYYAEITYVWPG